MYALLKTVKEITRINSRCRVIELLYTPETIPQPDGCLENLQTSIVELYAVVLKATSNSHRLFSANTALRAGHAIISPGEADGMIEELRNLEQTLNGEVQVCEAKRSSEGDRALSARMEKLDSFLRDSEGPLFRIGHQISGFVELATAEDRLKLLQWTSPIPFASHHELVRESRTKGTCEWLLRHPEFLEWHQASSSVVLFLFGSRRFTSLCLIPMSRSLGANEHSWRGQDLLDLEDYRLHD